MINGLERNTLTDNDLILDESSTDKDVLNVNVNRATSATITNIEAINYNWTSNADLDFDGTNVSGSTVNLSGTSLAFSGNATVLVVGDNNINAASSVNDTLSLDGIKSSVINAVGAKEIELGAALATTVGEKMSATIVINRDVEIRDIGGALNTLDSITLQSAKDGAGVELSATLPSSGVTVTGDKSLTLEMVVTGETVKNSLTAGKLTINATDVNAVDVSKAGGHINLVAAATAVTVADGQTLSVQTTGQALGGAAGGDITSLLSNAAANGSATVTLSTDGDIGLITALDISAIGKLNLVVNKDADIAMVVDSDNDVVISGAGDLGLAATTAGPGDSISIDASALTGDLDFTADLAVGDEVTVLIGSATGDNTIDLTGITTARAVVTTGSGDDEITIGDATGNLTIATGLGDDTVTVNGELTGTVALNGGGGKDVLITTDDEALADGIDGASKVTFTGFETLDFLTNTVVNNVQISGSTALVTNKTEGTGGANLNVFVYDKTSVATTSTTDLSKLTFDNVLNQDFATVFVTGSAAADTIIGSKVDDTIDAGAGADIIDLTAGGSDTVIVDNGDSSKSKMDQIIGFNTSSSSSSSDTLDIGAGAILGDIAAIAAVDVKAAVSGGTGSETVTATVTDGIISLSGAQAGAINTLSEYIAVAGLLVNNGPDVVGFVFQGSTYIVEAGATSATSDDIVVELVGVTGATLDIAAGSNTIVIA